MEQQRHLKTSLSSSHLPKLPSRPPESERGAWLTCFSAFRALIPPRGIIRAFKTPFPPPSPPQKQWRETGAADKWGFLGRKNYAFSGGGRISARCLPQIHIMRRPGANEPFSFLPSFPTFQCQKLRLVLAHADLRGEFVHAALRLRRSVVSRKKFRHDMNNHTVSQSRSSSSSFELCQIWRRSLFPGRVWRGPGEIFWAPPRAFVLSLSGNFLANLNVDFILRRL